MPPRSGRLWPFILVLVFIHFTMHLSLGWSDGAPDLLTAGALIAARRLPGAAAAGVGFVLGLLRDALSFVSFGASALALTILCYLGARSRDVFEGDSLFFTTVYLFIGGWLHYIAVAVLAPESVRGDTAAALFVRMPVQAAYGAGAGVVALLVFRAVTGERA